MENVTKVPPFVKRLLYTFKRFGVPQELQGQFIGRGVASRRAKPKKRTGGLPRVSKGI